MGTLRSVVLAGILTALCYLRRRSLAQTFRRLVRRIKCCLRRDARASRVGHAPRHQEGVERLVLDGLSPPERDVVSGGSSLSRDRRARRTVGQRVDQCGDELGVEAPENGNMPGSLDNLALTQAVIMESAVTMAKASSVPGISEIATLLAVLLKLSIDHRNNARVTKQKARWCRSMMVLLKKAEEVLANVSLPWITSISVKICVLFS